MATFTWHACKYQYINSSRGASSNALHSGRGLRLTHCIHALLPSVGQWVILFWAHQHNAPPSGLQALIYDILPWTTVVVSYAIGPRKLSANEQFFVGAQTIVSLLQTTQIISDLFLFCNWPCFLTPVQMKPKSFETSRNPFFSFFLFFTRGGCASCLCACLGARVLLRRWPRLWTAARR